MANNNTYTWKFPAIDVYTQQGNYTDVVYSIHWRLRGEDQSTSHSVELYGVQSVAPYNPNSSSFIPYENLTKEIVTGWVSSAMGPERYNEMTASIDTRIEQLINPPTQQLPPPWNS